MKPLELKEHIEDHWPDKTRVRLDAFASATEVTCTRAVLADLCRLIFQDLGFGFARLIVEEGSSEWQLRYAFYAEGEAGCVAVVVSWGFAEDTCPSIVEWIY